jgi:hypothetical protein
MKPRPAILPMPPTPEERRADRLQIGLTMLGIVLMLVLMASGYWLLRS